MKRRFHLAVVAALLGICPLAAQSGPSSAPLADSQLADPVREAEARALMEELRCLTCEGQSIADSEAPMAGDMRHEVRTRIAAGEQPEDVRRWLVERYGDYVSFAPKLGSSTWPLFAAPLLLMLLAGLALFHRIGRKPE